MVTAQSDATEANKLYTRMRTQLGIGGTGDQSPGNAPADMLPGTVEHYSALDAAGKAAYLKNSKVPEDVRKYLGSLH